MPYIAAVLIRGLSVFTRLHVIERKIELGVDFFPLALIILNCVVEKDQILVEKFVEIVAETEPALMILLRKLNIFCGQILKFDKV